MSDVPIRIRKFQVGDFDELYQIDQICFPADIAFSRGDLIFCLHHPKSIAWIAEGPGGILGFTVARIESRSSAHILTLDVIPEARQRKIGTSLMNRLHLELKRQKIGLSFLEVEVQNLPAQRLYEKLNYRHVETLIGYYRSREDAYRMMRVHEFTR
jgi:ribosomal protein S18 acetylase RimI-like enzyme